MTRVTTHFSVDEFAQPARHGFPDVVPYPHTWVISRLTPLCELLEVIGKAAGRRRIKVLSGYRDADYNAAIGGARKSQHMDGRAADIEIDGMSAIDSHALVLQLYRAQAIPRLRGLGSYTTFVHIDIRQSFYLRRWSGSRSGL